MSLFGGSQSPPSQPPFNPIPISGPGGIPQQALNQDISRYLSYNFPVFPGLATARQNEINDAYQQLTGPLMPVFQQDFMNRATVGSQAVTGGGDPYSGMGLRTGSFGKGAQSASFTRQVLAKQDYDRSRLEGLIQQNPVPGLGLTQQDVASLYIYNTGAQNAWSMSNYANQVAAANANYANQQANYAAIGNTISQLGNIYTQYQLYNNSAPPGPGWGA